MEVRRESSLSKLFGGDIFCHFRFEYLDLKGIKIIIIHFGGG